ncbi:MAG: nitroreductase family protein [Balneolaceae bacterium]|jgi:nitroreductase
MLSIDAKDKIKEAPAGYPIHELLKSRWSPRSFSDESVNAKLLHQLFEAARWAPSSYNEQPWRFIVARKEDGEDFEKLAGVMNEFNRNWAAKAPVLVLGLTKKNFSLNGRPNPHAGHDLGQAIAHLTFEASRHDLYVHQMAGILPEKARILYDIPDEYEPLTMFSIGYLGDPETLNDKLKEREQAPRNRKQLEEIVFDGEWAK